MNYSSRNEIYIMTMLRKDWIPKSNPRLRYIKGNILGIGNWPRKKWKLVSLVIL